MSEWAIRFRSTRPGDAGPALYLSTDARRPNKYGARVTSVPCDVLASKVERCAFLLTSSPYVLKRCVRDHLDVDVIPYADAIADLTTE